MDNGCVYEIYFHFITPNIIEFHVKNYDHSNSNIIRKIGDVLKKSFGSGRNNTVASKINPKHYDKKTYKMKIDICKESIVA